jgi:hypothetical protein
MSPRIVLLRAGMAEAALLATNANGADAAPGEARAGKNRKLRDA